MKSCDDAKNSGCGHAGFEHCSNLDEMVSHFLSERRDLQQREKNWWGDPSLSPDKGCRRAMWTLGREGIRDPHQWVYTTAYLHSLGEQLATHAADLETAKDFGDLYRRVESALQLRPNRKPLLVYDIARRLGYMWDREPEEVYLHAGAKIGAQALRPELGRCRSRPLNDFPTSIRTRLTPSQTEDFLCLASDALSSDLWD